MRALASTLVLGATSSCQSIGMSDAPVSAQRPTLSSDTATTVESTFELETGVAWDPKNFVDTPTSLKYGIGPTTEVFLNGSPVQYIDRSPGAELGSSDLLLGLRHRFREESEGVPSAAIQASVKLPTAGDDDFGTGELDASFAGILTKDFDGYVATGFYSLDILGDPLGGTDVGHSLALASTIPMQGRFGAFGELAAILIPDQDVEQVFTTFGVTYNPHASLVFDLGLALGLNDEAPDYRLVIGFTRNLGM